MVDLLVMVLNLYFQRQGEANPFRCQSLQPHRLQPSSKGVVELNYKLLYDFLWYYRLPPLAIF
jgi:hypothetical protein